MSETVVDAEGNSDAIETNGRAASRFAELFSEREPHLFRARRLARLTEYTLFREMGANSATSEIVPWQSLGAYGVNNLASKVMLAMYPPGISNINLKPTKEVLRSASYLNMSEDQRGKLKAAIDKGLAKEEQEYVEACEEDGDRMVLYDAIRHLIVGGNHAIKVCKEGQLQSIRFERYVTVRDRMGNLLEFVIQQPMAFQTLDEDCQKIAQKYGYGPSKADPETGEDTGEKWEEGDNTNPIWNPISVYTHGKLMKNGQWVVYDEIYSEEVPNSKRRYKEGSLPFLFLRMIALEGEAYGRSYVESYEGDLQSYDGVWQIITEGGAIIAKSVILVKPGGSTSKKAVAEAGNGDVLTGDAEDVAFIRSDKGGDLETTYRQAEKLEQRLGKIFMIFDPRQGERVTREEIIETARQLDATLGGLYSNLVVTLQKPLAELKMQVYQRTGRLEKLPKGLTKMTILTGIAALGRDQKAQNLEDFVAFWAKTMPQQFPAYLSISNALERSAANRTVDTDGLVKSEDEVQAAQQAQQQDELTKQVAPQIVQQGGQMMQNAQQAAMPPQQQQPSQQPSPQQDQQ